MRLLIADKFPEVYVAQFRALGLTVEYKPELTAEQLTAACEDVQLLVVRSTKVTRATIERARGLELVIRAGAGVDTIDVDAASERGIYVTNCPGKNSVAVAELAIGLMLALDRRIPHQTADLRRGAWNKKEYGKADGLKGKTLGIVGLGAIGQEVARRAAALEMEVVTYSIPENPQLLAELGVRPCASLMELAEICDVVSVHMPQTAQNEHMFGVEFFARMKPGAMFLNTSRGGLVDSGAMERAMREKGLRVALDVYEGEPEGGASKFELPLFAMDGFVGTHHVGASTEQAQNAIAAEAVRICRDFVATGQAANVVNIERTSPAKVQLIVRHYDKVGVLAAVLDVIRRHEVNVEEMTNTIFAGAKAAVAVIRLSAAPPDSLIEEIAKMEDRVIQVSAKPC